jgi:NADPH2:quinone reductase
MGTDTIPAEMSAVVLDAYTGVDALRVEKRPVPRPGANQVLVKMAASPINPSDLMFLQGKYGFEKPLPTIPGFEGSGVVVETGGGVLGRFLHGRRVACVTQSKGDGVWADYVLTTSNFALPLAGNVDLEQGAMSAVNPLTAVALIEIAQKGGHRTIVNTAAASALGQMLIRLGKREGIRVINTVRRDAQVRLLQDLGADIVLNSSDPEFAAQLRAACHAHDCHLAFDAIAGPATQQLLAALPRRSTVTIYGGLSQEAAPVTPDQAIFGGKTVNGFWLSSWLARKNFLQALRLWRRAQKLLGGTLRTEVRARYPLQDVRTAVSTYESEMTGGKVLLLPAR